MYRDNLFNELIVDNFAGGGGASVGIELAVGRPVDIAINHDADAIAMHRVNHPYTTHYQEDMFAIDPEQVTGGRPVGIAWFSPDCKHFSKAKGGKPVNKKIRGLSWVVLKWALSGVAPRVIFMENVEEIQTWGPLMETAKGLYPDPARAGETFKAFVAMLTTGIDKAHPAFAESCDFLKITHDSIQAERLAKGLGYSVDWRVLKACDYGVEGQIGLEETVEEYIDKLVAIFREVKRVLKPDGTLWVNIADSYAGSGKGASKYPENALKYKQGTNKGLLGTKLKPTPKNNCKAKDLLGVPWLLAFALRADGWYWRQVDIWNKSNCMPESVTDRCTNSHEYILLFSKSSRYYFDYQAIEEPCVGTNNYPPAGSEGGFRPNSRRRVKGNRKTFRGGAYTSNKSFDNSAAVENTAHGNMPNESGMRRKRSVWTVAIKGSKYHHFATFPPALIVPCILAGCKAGGTVLDPFAGTGTVGVVAHANNRDYILIDLAPGNVEICKSRLEGTT